MLATIFSRAPHRAQLSISMPDSLLADPDAASLRWRMDFIRAHLERDSPQLGPRIPAETLRRLWTMLAHHQGGLLNAAALARALAVDGKIVALYLDLLVALLLAHPVAGGSWEGLAIESLIAAAPEGTQASCFRTAAGAEIDLLLKLPGQRAPWAIEIKRSLAPKIERGFHLACDDVKPGRRRVVYDGTERFAIAEVVEAVSLVDLCAEVAAG